MARAALGLTGAQLAAKVGVRTATVSDFERGADSKSSTITKLREALEEGGAVFIGPGEASLHGGAGVRLREKP